jgi:hypothetical protein
VVGGQDPEFEDCLGAGQSPAGAGDVHPVFDEVAGALDDSGGDGSSLGEGGGVVEVAGLAGQVVGGGVGGCADPGR